MNDKPCLLLSQLYYIPGGIVASGVNEFQTYASLGKLKCKVGPSIGKYKSWELMAAARHPNLLHVAAIEFTK